jgi:hypothetical protein
MPLTAGTVRFTFAFAESGKQALTLPIAKSAVVPFYRRKKVFFAGNNSGHVGDKFCCHAVNARDPAQRVVGSAGA